MERVIRPFTEADLPAVVDYWNRSFGALRNFTPMTEDRFRDRILKVDNVLERFEPEHLLLCRAGADVVGMVHVGVHAEGFCEVCYDDWDGGDQGYVAFLHVDPAERKRGLGDRLWRAAMDLLEAHGGPVLDGQCMSPYYGNSDGPRPTFWGTPEGIAPPWGDEETRGFLSRRGHQPGYKGVSLERRLGGGAVVPAVPEPAEGVGFRVERGRFPVVGDRLSSARAYPEAYRFEVDVAVRGDDVLGTLCTYPWDGLAEPKWGVFEMIVAPEARGLGIGSQLLGRFLTRRTLEGTQVVEAFTIPEISEAALGLYFKHGFQVVEDWAIYSSRGEA